MIRLPVEAAGGALDGGRLELYTTAAEAAIRQAERHRSARETAAGLRIALTTRAVIDQAKGILMAARSISADEAFAVLVNQSQNTNVKVRAVAEQLIEQVCRTEP